MHPDQVPSFIAQNVSSSCFFPLAYHSWAVIFQKFEFIDQQLDKKSLSSCQDAELRKGLESILIDIDKPWKNDAVFTWIHVRTQLICLQTRLPECDFFSV